MDPVAGIAIACLVVILLAILWARPEYGLFLYGVSIGFPDLAVPLGPAVNIRIDDLLMALLLPRALLMYRIRFTARQCHILFWAILFFALCLLSAMVGAAVGRTPNRSDVLRLLGCGTVMLVMPALVHSWSRLWFVVAGLTCGGVVLISQIALRLGQSSTVSYATAQDLKSAAGFATWNANTAGQAALLLTFAAGTAAVLARRRSTCTVYVVLATIFALTPLALLIRGSAIAVSAGYVGFLCLTKRWKVLLVAVIVAFVGVGYWYAIVGDAVSIATRVDVSTGAGFSGRYDTWHTAIEAISASPLVGYGFGQELRVAAGIGRELRSHNSFLSVWIELGPTGVGILLALISEIVLAGLSIYKYHPLRSYGALLVALVVALGLDSLVGLTLYWEKLPIIALSVGVSLIGCCERTWECQTELSSGDRTAIHAYRSMEVSVVSSRFFGLTEAERESQCAE